MIKIFYARQNKPNWMSHLIAAISVSITNMPRWLMTTTGHPHEGPPMIISKPGTVVIIKVRFNICKMYSVLEAL